MLLIVVLGYNVFLSLLWFPHFLCKDSFLQSYYLLISWFEYTLNCSLWWHSKDGWFLTVIAIFNKNKLLLHQFFLTVRSFRTSGSHLHICEAPHVEVIILPGAFYCYLQWEISITTCTGVCLMYKWDLDSWYFMPSPLTTVEHARFFTQKKVLTCIVDEFLTRWERRPSQRPHWYASSLDCWCFPLIAGL